MRPDRTREHRAAGRADVRGTRRLHPDRFVQQVPALKALVATRRALADPKRFGEAAAQVTQWAKVSTPAVLTKEPASPVARTVNQGGSVLDQILAQTDGGGPEPKPGIPEDLQRLLDDLVAHT